MSEIFLHCYDASPFTQKALRMMGLKKLSYTTVETPMMPPKDDLTALTGGYRGTPVMQIGADVYIDTQRIAAELERRFPEPGLCGSGDRGLHYMLVKWSDAFFYSALAIAIDSSAASWPAPFLADRKTLFAHLDFDAMRQDVAHSMTQYRAHAALIEKQLADGRAFLAGAAPSLADIQAHSFVWMGKCYFPQIADGLFAGLRRILQWDARMEAIGVGTRSTGTAEQAFAAALAVKPVALHGVDAYDPLRLAAGDRVQVGPDDSRRGAVQGELVSLTPESVALLRSHDRCGEVIVHFPRLGYRIERA
ncbi:MAG: glutathione S-transferase family protein [Steroidobacteraceae bacterium]